ncbi:MAG: MCE family protein [Bacteroidetes bacterium]|nr:MCE family protein [Bacteroidota bacterium]MBU1115889.1 MCE family protein [Bacteroidota bacterium]MBU1797837.1 MCE family protein [Bacteroidota bacterium]
MFKSFEGARLGIFIFIGSLLIVISIFTIGNKESLFVETIVVNSRFENVEGLKTGAPVRLSGYTIGSVSNIVLEGDSAGTVIVKMHIEKTLQHFIRLDSEASIVTEGLVGKKVVSITPGSQNQSIIEEGSFIKSKTPLNITQVIEDTQSIIIYIKNITKDFADIVQKVNAGDGSIGKLVNNDDLYTAAVDVTSSAKVSLDLITAKMGQISELIVETNGTASKVFKDIDTTMVAVKKIVTRVENGDGSIGKLINDNDSYDSLRVMVNNLTATTEAAKIGLISFSENMEALKHNWLFKKYFEERGYWSKTETDNKIEQLDNQNKLLEQKIKELLKLKADIKEMPKK